MDSWNPFTWFQQGVTDAAQNWFSGMGGMIASGLEGGFIAFMKDLWHTMQGPAWILLGSIIVIITLLLYFREPMNQAAARSIGTIARAMI